MNKEVQIVVRLTKKHLEKLKQKALRKDMKLSEYIRSKLT